MAVAIKTNFDVFYSEPDKDIKARRLPLVLSLFPERVPSAPGGRAVCRSECTRPASDPRAP